MAATQEELINLFDYSFRPVNKTGGTEVNLAMADRERGQRLQADKDLIDFRQGLINQSNLDNENRQLERAEEAAFVYLEQTDKVQEAVDAFAEASAMDPAVKNAYAVQAAEEAGASKKEIREIQDSYMALNDIRDPKERARAKIAFAEILAANTDQNAATPEAMKAMLTYQTESNLLQSMDRMEKVFTPKVMERRRAGLEEKTKAKTTEEALAEIAKKMKEEKEKAAKEAAAAETAEPVPQASDAVTSAADLFGVPDAVVDSKIGRKIIDRYANFPYSDPLSDPMIGAAAEGVKKGAGFGYDLWERAMPGARQARKGVGLLYDKIFGEPAAPPAIPGVDPVTGLPLQTAYDPEQPLF